MLFVFHICNKLPLKKAARPQRLEINIDIFVYIYIYIYIYIKPKGIYQPYSLMSNGWSRPDDAAQTK